jgi:hypothetical protein
MRRRLAILFVLFVSLGAAAAPDVARAQGDWAVDADQSLFAVLIRPAGPAAKLAHPHLVVARGAEIGFTMEGERGESARFTFEAAVLSLDADPTAERQALAGRLAELAGLEEKLPPVDENDRKKIRKEMIGASQLAAERFPAVRAELLGVERRGGGGDGGARVALGWNARVRIEVRGETIEKTFPLRWEIEGDRLTAEVLGEAKFTELGIEPYSAVLGAIRNADLFHFYVRLVARRR